MVKSPKKQQSPRRHSTRRQSPRASPSASLDHLLLRIPPHLRTHNTRRQSPRRLSPNNTDAELAALQALEQGRRVAGPVDMDPVPGSLEDLLLPIPERFRTRKTQGGTRRRRKSKRGKSKRGKSKRGKSRQKKRRR